MEKKSEEKISYRLQFLDIARSMASWLLNLVDNLPEWNHTINWRHRHGDKKLNECNTKIMSVVLLEYTNVEHNIIQYNCLHFKKKNKTKKKPLAMWKLKNEISNKYKFANHINNFIFFVAKICLSV